MGSQEGSPAIGVQLLNPGVNVIFIHMQLNTESSTIFGLDVKFWLRFEGTVGTISTTHLFTSTNA